jgi:hypothetical protein
MPDRVYAWRERVFVPASLTGWKAITDPKDRRPKPEDQVMEFIFDGATSIGDSASRASTWATPFSTDTNYDAIKIESADRKYSRVYDLSRPTVDVDGDEVQMTKA